MELNQRYESAAVVPDPTAGRGAVGRGTASCTCRPPPGPARSSRTPGWSARTGDRVSTLDVTGKGKFTLLTGLAGQAWKHAAQKLDLPFLRTVVVGEPGTIDPYGYWRGVREIDEAGALLVRPDGYVAWRPAPPVWDADEALHQLTDALTASWPPATQPTAPGARYSTGAV